ncbi:LysR family transcriptional regulator [Sandaracinus amylolyticus]|uniref:LysR family transcriptional regulator n=1 Tax=Sandaracinus amylolyticus TaxID=927083 RepID=UPI001F1AC556|nr:LysR family transcriptional regulator [Sandaracinus amylolyticus]
MHETNLAAIDLNLLVALDALLEERSVTRAARRLGLSQPATSHALARLRELASDPLLVRSGAALVPTPRAEALGPAVRAILADIRRTLAGERFDPTTTRRAFTIGTADYGELVLLPSLLRVLAREAPGIDIVVRPVPEDSGEALASGKLDLVIVASSSSGVAPSLEQRRLFDDGFSCLVRADHPVLDEPWTVDRFAEMGHVFIAPHGTRGGVVDDALARIGRNRRVVVMVPSFLGAPAIVSESDLVVTLPSRLAARIADAFALEVIEPPLPLPRFTLVAVWHERSHRDPAHAWMRNAIAAAARELSPPRAPTAPRGRARRRGATTRA